MVNLVNPELQKVVKIINSVIIEHVKLVKTDGEGRSKDNGELDDLETKINSTVIVKDTEHGFEDMKHVTEVIKLPEGVVNIKVLVFLDRGSKEPEQIN